MQFVWWYWGKIITCNGGIETLRKHPADRGENGSSALSVVVYMMCQTRPNVGCVQRLNRR